MANALAMPFPVINIPDKLKCTAAALLYFTLKLHRGYDNLVFLAPTSSLLIMFDLGNVCQCRT